MPSKKAVRVSITGAAGQIGYQLAFRIASGQLFGKDQPIILQLIEITPAMEALNGVAMELDDCSFDTFDKVIITDDLKIGFKDTNYAFLVGAKPRTADIERKDLLLGNAKIFSEKFYWESIVNGLQPSTHPLKKKFSWRGPQMILKIYCSSMIGYLIQLWDPAIHAVPTF